jgi:hypothetical protein
MKVKTNNRFLFFYITLIYVNCITSPISAAELEISLTNDLGKPLADAVAALIPIFRQQSWINMTICLFRVYWQFA